MTGESVLTGGPVTTAPNESRLDSSLWSRRQMILKLLYFIWFCAKFQQKNTLMWLLVISLICSQKGKKSEWGSTDPCSAKVSKALLEKWSNTELFLVHIFLHSNWIQENTEQKKLFWTLFTHQSSQKVNLWLFKTETYFKITDHWSKLKFYHFLLPCTVFRLYTQASST